MDVKDHKQLLHSYGNLSTVFEASDVDDASAVQYFGFINGEGSWIIQKYDTSASPKTLRYAAGKTTYSDAWTGRAGLSYGYYNALFS